METNIKGITDSIQKLADISMGTLKTSVENASKNITEMSKRIGSGSVPSWRCDRLIVHPSCV